MGWIRPKLDWTASDYINYVDVNRWIKNLTWLRNNAIISHTVPEFEPMTLKTSYSDMIYASEINAIENNLDTLATALELDVGEKSQYEANGTGFDYNEINRIEEGIYIIYEFLGIRVERHFVWNFGKKGVFM